MGEVCRSVGDVPDSSKDEEAHSPKSEISSSVDETCSSQRDIWIPESDKKKLIG